MKRFATLFVILAMVFAFTFDVYAQQPAPPAPAAKFRLATGKKTGNYYFAGATIAEQLKGNRLVNVEVIETQGSLENIQMLVAGEADGAIVQKDAIKAYLMDHPDAQLELEEGGTLYPEYVHLVVNNQSGIKNITDLNNNHTILIGPPGSGTHTTWRNFVSRNKELAKVATLNVDDTRALNMIRDGQKAQAIMFVSGLNSGVMQKIDGQGDGLVLSKISDSNLFKGEDKKKPIYMATEIPAGTYKKNLQTGWFSSVDTIAVDSVLVTKIAYVDTNSKAYNAFLDGFLYALPKIKQHVGYTGK